MEIKISSQISAKELYHFLLYHTYSSVWGFTGVIISICALFAFISITVNTGNIFSGIGFLLAAILFLVVQPIRLYIQTQRMIESDKGYQNPIHYIFTNRGIHLQQEEAEAFCGWQDVRKIISTKTILAIYVGKEKVLKLSKKDIAEQYNDLKDMMQINAVYAVKKFK